jgi:hypothetical protein
MVTGVPAVAAATRDRAANNRKCVTASAFTRGSQLRDSAKASVARLNAAGLAHPCLMASPFRSVMTAFFRSAMAAPFRSVMAARICPDFSLVWV